ncbi:MULTISPECIES: DUF1992 domain-containing protein [unclassified Rathayibacter]|uniref:DnaJ family domain-containing protein n=1 Tax=unclassified Rathayibacter TaxID=2609250 RepID=UPI001FB24D13|nr:MULTISPECIES: DUF1992 domain-containing protein [unclassified Rathayibacter]MCJ1673349.1 DUF1992 domain-containing protein [Rathayibacter sp. VKM Ac-2929]MCJ1682902.1 DUF1992 domain-containing protein [Rathayibacter sp. VKM Ac-2928]
MSEARDRAARYAAERATGGRPETGDERTGSLPENAEDRAAFIETSIQQAIRRGEFDGLPGAGKPLEGLGEHHDPDWWIRRKIERENLTGIGPAAFLLRAEDRRLDEQLDRLIRESEVRAVLADFNKRVVEARRQLLGGPPVVTPLRDIDAEVSAWTERRSARFAAAEAQDPVPPRRRWWHRR